MHQLRANFDPLPAKSDPEASIPVATVTAGQPARLEMSDLLAQHANPALAEETAQVSQEAGSRFRLLPLQPGDLCPFEADLLLDPALPGLGEVEHEVKQDGAAFDPSSDWSMVTEMGIIFHL